MLRDPKDTVFLRDRNIAQIATPFSSHRRIVEFLGVFDLKGFMFRLQVCLHLRVDLIEQHRVRGVPDQRRIELSLRDPVFLQDLRVVDIQRFVMTVLQP